MTSMAEPVHDPPPPDPGAEPPDGGRRRTVVIVVSAVAVAAIVALLVVGLMNQGVESTIQDALAEGERPEAPALQLPVLTAGDGVGPVGSQFDLTDLRGSVVVLNFWASWCPPCEAEAPLLEGVARGYRSRGEEVVVLGVDVEDLADSAREFIARHEVSYPNVRDKGDDVKLRFEVGQLPETFVIDADGRIALKHIGQLTSPAQLTTPIEQLLAEGA
jgi:cytochrome c biogenesis protein CcmG/thiol:disulfide interchange protein DsbE